VWGVGNDAVNRRGPSTAQPRLADHEQARHGRGAVALGDLATLADHRRAHKPGIDVEAGGPDHGCDGGLTQVKFARRLGD
jgi:hypothetical protein